MKILNYFDLKLINLFQEISDQVQAWIGINNFHLARICLWLYAITICWSEITNFIIEKKVNTFTFIFLLIMWAVFNFFISRGEKKTVGTSFKNIYLSTFESMRKVYLLLFAVSLTSFIFKSLFGFTIAEIEIFLPFKKALGTLGSLLILAVVYFASCTPKPKKPSKLKQFISSLSSKKVSTQRA